MEKEKRLIDANALLESIEGTDWYTIRVDGSVTQGAPSEEVAWYKATDIYAAVENAPTVDAVEVVHGRWVQKEFWTGGGTWRCSECGRQIMFMNGTPTTENVHYCPNCGADMRERKDNG